MDPSLVAHGLGCVSFLLCWISVEYSVAGPFATVTRNMPHCGTYDKLGGVLWVGSFFFLCNRCMTSRQVGTAEMVAAQQQHVYYTASRWTAALAGTA